MTKIALNNPTNGVSIEQNQPISVVFFLKVQGTFYSDLRHNTYWIRGFQQFTAYGAAPPWITR